MRIKRAFPVLFGFLIFVAAVALIVQLRKHAPPEPARLLPGADAFLYIDLKWMRRADIATHIPEVPHDPEYEQFIRATGFQFERDLQEAALAIHYASPLTGGETRYSEIFIAKIDGDRLRDYLRVLTRSIDSYRSVDIYNIPLQGRTLRVAILGVDTVAASNHPDAGVIRGIIDRSRKLASPFGGPALLRQFYKRVPIASLAWGIFRVNPQSAQSATDISLPFSSPATVVASVRYLRAVHFRAEAFTPDEQTAQQLTTQVNTFLSIFQSAEIAAAGQTPDPDVKKALDSLKVEQKSDRTVLTAVLPTELLRKIVAEAPKQVGPGAENRR
ncbi:MAG: hypothetical protein JWN74_1894 [Acidobacteriaceae bacterium]|nr:hypothetical protein [Acidobacteriaceae bacterium]